ncbi:hypothetical protein [Kordia jejudonensis]|uniref:hypothetical protein n=1 Tax=Kordia jejudonensis TaxID=1348245 RepID=UPI0006293A64|nr:hypothetical protein [Kordia jejudonensis]
MKKKKSSLKLLRIKIANLNAISNLIGGTGNAGDPDPVTKGNTKSKDDAKCASRVLILSICTDGNTGGDPNTDPQ